MRKRSDGGGRLTKYLGGSVEYFLFMSLRCARVGLLRMEDVNVTDGEVDWDN